MAKFLEQLGNLYDFDSHFIEVGGVRLHYLDEGSGRPVLLLHGNPTWSFMYRDLVRHLRDSSRVIVPDHIGCGLSDKPDETEYRYGYDQRVKDLEQLLQSLRLDTDLSLVLHDWGGLIGMAYAVKNPERIRRIAILNTAAFTIPEAKSLHWTLRFCRSSGLAALLIRGVNAFSHGALYLGCRRPLSRAVRRGYLGPYNSWRNRLAVLRFVQDIPVTSRDPAFRLLFETEQNLKRLAQKPVLICWGEKDLVFDEYFLSEWCVRFPRARVHTFKRAGHYVLEDESEEVCCLIKNFLMDE